MNVLFTLENKCGDPYGVLHCNTISPTEKNKWKQFVKLPSVGFMFLEIFSFGWQIFLYELLQGVCDLHHQTQTFCFLTNLPSDRRVEIAFLEDYMNGNNTDKVVGTENVFQVLRARANFLVSWNRRLSILSVNSDNMSYDFWNLKYMGIVYNLNFLLLNLYFFFIF